MLLNNNFDYFVKGVSGAYSESAAEKAYPNCEAVPCEQFDTAFEVSNWSLPLLVLYVIVKCYCHFE